MVPTSSTITGWASFGSSCWIMGMPTTESQISTRATWSRSNVSGYRSPCRAGRGPDSTLAHMDRIGIAMQLLSNIPKTPEALRASNDLPVRPATQIDQYQVSHGMPRPARSLHTGGQGFKFPSLPSKGNGNATSSLNNKAGNSIYQ